MWPAPQRAGHTTQLITTNEREKRPAGEKENAFATKRVRLTTKRTVAAVAGRDEKQGGKKAVTLLQHRRPGKVTANFDERPGAGMNGIHGRRKRRARTGAPLKP
jgi:hypothetical protein